MYTMSIAITLVRNSSQSDRRLIRVTAASPDDLTKALGKAARDKLRIRQPTFYYEGAPLVGVDPGTLPRAITVLVCNGTEKPTGAIGRAPVEVPAVRVTVDEGATESDREQFHVQSQLPGMIECHWYSHRVRSYQSHRPHPELISDPGWGFTVFRLSLKPADLDRKLVKYTRRYHRIKWGTQSWGWAGERAPWMSKWENQYGTVEDPGEDCLLWASPNTLYLVVYCGSRGLGQEIQKRFGGTEEYMHWHQVAVRWATSNRRTVAEQVCHALHNDEPELLKNWTLQQIIPGEGYTHLYNVTEDGTPVLPDASMLLHAIDPDMQACTISDAELKKLEDLD